MKNGTVQRGAHFASRKGVLCVDTSLMHETVSYDDRTTLTGTLRVPVTQRHGHAELIKKTRV